MTSYLVTVHADGNPDYTAAVVADREGLAQTRAMVRYPYQLRGALVTYTVAAIDEQCRCWHGESLHTGEDGACAAPDHIVGDGIFRAGDCSCERFRYPDSDE
jgi:hypothetical protein